MHNTGTALQFGRWSLIACFLDFVFVTQGCLVVSVLISSPIQRLLAAGLLSRDRVPVAEEDLSSVSIIKTPASTVKDTEPELSSLVSTAADMFSSLDISDSATNRRLAGIFCGLELQTKVLQSRRRPLLGFNSCFHI